MRPGTISRPAVVNRLRAAREAAVVLLTAPPGYGKTTVLAEWDQRDERPFAWISADGLDDAYGFLTYVSVALARIGVGEPVDLDGAKPPHLRELRARIANALARCEHPIVLAIDDVHLLRAPHAVDALAVFAGQMGAGSQLALASRAEPPLPLARLRAKGQLVELGVDELSLSDRGAGLLLRRAGVELPEAEVAELNRRVEGWPAGLYLAALSLAARRDGVSRVGSFNGFDRFVSDYFRLELISSLPERQLLFLTRASILEDLCGSLCDAVLDRSGSAAELDSLERANLFLAPLDRERRWYRLHRLFRDTLRDELERREPDRVNELRLRAADWCEAHGDVASAIDYAAAAGDATRVVNLVEAAALRVYHSGRFATVEGWFEHLDDEQLLEQHPAVAVLGAWTHALRGRAEAADRWAAAAERSEMTGTMPDGSANLASWTRLLRAAACRDGVDRMRRDAERAAAQIAPGSLWRGTCLSILAAAYLLAGDDRRADAVFADAYEAAQGSGAVEAASIALAERSLVAIARGAWREAEGLAHRARDMVREAELDDYATSSIVYAASGRAALRQSDWVRAHDDIDRSERLLPLLTHALPWLAVQVRLELVRLHLALTDTTRARELMAEVDELLVRRPDLGVLADEAAELRARLDTDRQSADGWASTLTAAELRLLPLLATHLSFRQIADRLRVSRNTVKTQAISVYRKLGVSSRSDAIDRAVELGLVGVDLGLPAPADPVGAP